MKRSKWTKWILVELLTGLLIVFLYSSAKIPAAVSRSLIFFYTGFSISTIILIAYLIYSQNTGNATQKIGRVWGGFLIKFMAAFVLIVVYLAIGGFREALEGMAVILLYLVFSWLSYSLAAKE